MRIVRQDLLTGAMVEAQLDDAFIQGLGYGLEELASFGGFLCHSAIGLELRKLWKQQAHDRSAMGQVFHDRPTHGWMSRNRWVAVQRCIVRVGRNPHYWTPEAAIERIWTKERSRLWKGMTTPKKGT